MKKYVLITLVLTIIFTIFFFYRNDKNNSIESYIIYDLNSKKVIAFLNKNNKIQPTSLAKILTAYIVLSESKDLDEYITITEKDFEGLEEKTSNISGLKIGNKVTVREALYGLLMKSGGDCAQALAIHNSGSVDKFVKKMNKYSKEIGMFNSNFKNPIGLDDKNQYTTVNDIKTLIEYVSMSKKFMDIWGMGEYKFKNIDLEFRRESSFYEGYNNKVKIVSSKKGYTNESKHCWAIISEYKNHKYILVRYGMTENKRGDSWFNVISYFIEIVNKEEN